MTKGFGKARRSAFTSTGALSKTRGYRATVLANMISYDVICQGSPDDWRRREGAIVLFAFRPRSAIIAGWSQPVFTTTEVEYALTHRHRAKTRAVTKRR